MTPAQFASCSEIFDSERKIQDAQFGYLRAIIAEPNRDRKKKREPYKIDDFCLFGEKAQESTKKAEPQTWKSQQMFVTQYLHPLLVSRANLEKKKNGG